jgi:hypothetical protein
VKEKRKEEREENDLFFPKRKKRKEQGSWIKGRMRNLLSLE